MRISSTIEACRKASFLFFSPTSHVLIFLFQQQQQQQTTQSSDWFSPNNNNDDDDLKNKPKEEEEKNFVFIGDRFSRSFDFTIDNID
ncbi:hypothetical protein DERP_009134 [Dermatophagoides pteronyssinus]|uniref:Uncharacterized protein n=1 Tax=Dermatophagoides pteronyssinus TaxID=6956 RepID=A0ABQ8JQM2_DERPT|nr:hypothetical protein DERP_009134 [Dermatophagoides pteronyssinus]